MIPPSLRYLAKKMSYTGLYRLMRKIPHPRTTSTTVVLIIYYRRFWNNQYPTFSSGGAYNGSGYFFHIVPGADRYFVTILTDLSSPSGSNRE